MRELNANEVQYVSAGAGSSGVPAYVEKFWKKLQTWLEKERAQDAKACFTAPTIKQVSLGFANGVAGTAIAAAITDIAGGGPVDLYGDGVALSDLIAGGADGAAKAGAGQAIKCGVSKI